MPRHCVQVAKISRHSLNLKGKATTMEKENHRNGGRQGASNPVEGRRKVHDRGRSISTIFLGVAEGVYVCVSEVTA